MNARLSGALLSASAVMASMLTTGGATGTVPGTAGAGGPAVAHRAGAVVADPVIGPIPSPRIFSTGVASVEPTFGISSTGALFVHAIEAGDVHRSIDGGVSWTSVAPTVASIETHQWTQDPYLYVDERTDRIFASDLIPPCQQISWSDDGGTTWTTSAGNCDQADHQTIFAGPPTVSEPIGYPNVVYDCAINGGALADASTTTTCDRSIDGGRTFLPTGGIPYTTAQAPAGSVGTWAVPGLCDGATGHGFVGPDGTVYLPRGWCGQPWLASSRDEGATWTRVQVATNGMQRGPSGSPAHDAGVVADDEGNVYYLWVAEDRLPYLAISRDGGAHFGAPMMIGPPGLDEAALPAIAIGASGKIAMTYMGTTTSPGGPFPSAATCRPVMSCSQPYGALVRWNNYITQTTDALAADPLFFSASMNDPSDPLVRGQCGPVRCSAQFDFIDVNIAPDGTAWSVFIDACPRTGACTAVDEGLQYVGQLAGGPSLR